MFELIKRHLNVVKSDIFFFKKKISSFDLFLIYIDIKNILFTYLIQGTNI